MKNVKEEKTVLTIKELMEELKISRSTAYKLARTKGFPIVRVGKRKLIQYAKLIEWIENGGSTNV